MILFCYGTRPEYIKIAPVLKHMARDVKTFCTGQHTGSMVPKGDFNLFIDERHKNRLDYIVKTVMDNTIIPWEEIKLIVVQGDTTSALAIALSAFHHQVPIAHIEAGLRTYNNQDPYPEEANRAAIARVTDIHLCPTKTARENLVAERCGGFMDVVGNPVLDHLVDLKPTIGKTILITMHRRENHPRIHEWMTAIDEVARLNPKCNFLFPVHPNPIIQSAVKVLKHVVTIFPLIHDEFLQILTAGRMVITDSGGVQEEAAFLKKFCIVARETTERTEGLDEVSFLSTPDTLADKTSWLLDKPWPEDYECPYGNGKSGLRIATLLNQYQSLLGTGPSVP